ncbi:MAG: type II toxin-antitoxin system VapC family toxin [Candidatus Rokubacteria bacterium]|nr:type II toxin-antitoxin system VapC family toxin [Candidatus Rokubacteria bacterium]
MRELRALVVDSSVAVKWFLPETGSDAAAPLLEGERALVAPDLLYPEVGNVLWKRVRRGELTPGEGGAVLGALTRSGLEIVPSAPLMPLALDIACRAGRTLYDSLYLAVAVMKRTALVTADRRLFDAVRKGPLAPHVLWLGDVR